MATYTMELWEVLELEPDIGLKDYPLFDESYREPLNRKIIEHFWNREIGTETISMFRQQLRRKMNERMPLHNQNYLASQIKFDPLLTMSVKTVSGTTAESVTEANGTVEGDGESTSTSDAKSRAVASNLPQVMLSGNGDYAENAQDNISNTGATGTTSESQTTTNNATATNTGTVDSETSGYQGNPAILIAEYRATLVNTDMDVINDLETLFMGIWDSSDAYNSERGYGHFGYFGYNGFSL